MKYKLKRDLPFAKAGAEVKIISVYSNEFPHSFYTLSIKGDLIKDWYRIEIPKDRFTEWIEEAKPRDWYAVVQGDSIYGCESDNYPSNTSKIKVREVLE